MKKYTADKLKSVFDKYDQQQAEKKKHQERIKTEHEVFLNNFDKIISEVIRPVMKELGEAIKSRGHNFEISSGHETQDSKGRTSDAHVKMEIYPNGLHQQFGLQNNYPSLIFFAGTYDNKIWTHVNTMMPGKAGQAGKRNEYDLESITTDIVEEEILNLLNKCFDG